MDLHNITGLEFRLELKFNRIPCIYEFKLPFANNNSKPIIHRSKRKKKETKTGKNKRKNSEMDVNFARVTYLPIKK